MSLQVLQERLVQLQETTAQLQALIDRLANLKLQPGSVPLGDDTDGPCEDGGVVAELGAEITQGLREADEDLELLSEEIEDLRPGREGSEAQKCKSRLHDSVIKLAAELKKCRVSFRKAQLSARQELAAARRAERAILLASYASPATPSRSGASSPAGPRRQQQQQQQQQQQRRRHQRSTIDGGPEDQVVGAAHNVTSSLRRTHDLMAAELARSAYAAQALAESTAALRELDQRYSGLDGMLAASRDLLGTLLRSQKSDTWYLQTALYMLLATAAWLIFRRLLYGPMWWFVWLPLRLIGKGVGGGVSLVGSGSVGDDASMKIAGADGAVTVVKMGGGGGSVPTVSVLSGGGDQEQQDKQPVDPDSESDRVGRIIDAAERAAEAVEDEPNPKKRMWQEPEEAAKYSASYADREESVERIRDEL